MINLTERYLDMEGSLNYGSEVNHMVAALSCEFVAAGKPWFVYVNRYLFFSVFGYVTAEYTADKDPVYFDLFSQVAKNAERDREPKSVFYWAEKLRVSPRQVRALVESSRILILREGDVVTRIRINEIEGEDYAKLDW